MMGTAMIKPSGPSPLGRWFRRARLAVVLPGLALGVLLGCGASSSGSAPTITGITPMYGPYGTAVTITGTGFSNGLKNVYFDGVGVTSGTYTSDTSVTVDVPAAAVTGSISVVNSGGTATYAEEFVVSPSLHNTFDSDTEPISPVSGAAGSLVTITGYGLEGISSVTITGYSPSITLLSQTANQITFDIPTGATVGSDTITLNNSYGSDASTIYLAFTVTGSSSSTSAPTITAISQTFGPYDTEVTITGSGFSDSLENVSFGGIPATTTIVNSDTSVNTYVPAAAVTGSISVLTAGGSATYPGEFIVAPSFNSTSPISPTTGDIGTLVTISGYGLKGVSSVTITGYSGSIPLLSQTANQITFDIPTGATVGSDTITLNNGYPSSDVSPIFIGFTVTASS